MYAGLDYTATPSANEPYPYGPCLVAVSNENDFEVVWQKMIVDCGEGATEIKGHDSSGIILRRALQIIIEADAKVALLLLDKKLLLNEAKNQLPPPAQLRLEMGCALIEKFLTLEPISRLLCDEDFKGKSEQAAFRTEILRINRRVQPESRMKVGFRPSHKSALIQAADVVAYVGSRFLRGAKLTGDLRREYKTLREENAVVMEVVNGWGKREIDLRP